jgi:hypothetical protein
LLFVEGCTPLWAACYNGERVTALDLLGAGATVPGPPGQTKAGVAMIAAQAARAQRHPGLADIVDAEQALRIADTTRAARLRSGEIDEGEFKTTLRAATRSPC